MNLSFILPLPLPVVLCHLSVSHHVLTGWSEIWEFHLHKHVNIQFTLNNSQMPNCCVRLKKESHGFITTWGRVNDADRIYMTAEVSTPINIVRCSGQVWDQWLVVQSCRNDFDWSVCEGSGEGDTQSSADWMRITVVCVWVCVFEPHGSNQIILQFSRCAVKTIGLQPTPVENSVCERVCLRLIYVCVCVFLQKVVVKASKSGHKINLSSFEVHHYFSKPSELHFFLNKNYIEGKVHIT